MPGARPGALLDLEWGAAPCDPCPWRGHVTSVWSVGGRRNLVTRAPARLHNRPSHINRSNSELAMRSNKII
eukprot:282917-Lingulodinium_polyedra.AAC.1